MYPVFLKLNSRSCLIIGGGRIACRKVKSLIEAGAKVTVIAPEIIPEMDAVIREFGCMFVNREYREGDVKGYFLVIASTDNTDVNNAVYTEAEANGILCNVVDIPDRCNFYVPAKIKRGDLLVAISTSGRAPYFAKKLRKFLQILLPESMEEDLHYLGNIRQEIIAGAGDDEQAKKTGFAEKLEPEAEKIINKIRKQCSELLD